MKDLFPRAACLQMEIEQGNVAANLKQLQQAVADMQPLPETLLVLPELWASGFDYPRISEHSRQTPALLTALEEIAAQYHIWIAGSLLEPRGEGKKPPWNTLYLTGPEGVQSRYRKQHLFSFWHEDEYLSPGTVPAPMESEFGPLGGLVCYDLRFPEISRAYSFAGCRIILVSAQWPMIRLDHWQVLLRARAVENQVWIVACNGGGNCADIELAGHSMIIDPLGRISAEAGEGRSSIQAELSEEALHQVRSRFCSVAERPWAGSDQDKILSLEQLQQQLSRKRSQGSRIVFTNGCFDLLHAGHVSYLEQARSCGDCLVLGLNSDQSVRRLKGVTRPVNSERDRARVLAALGCIDYIIIFDEDTPHDLISILLPDVLVKGADWPEDQIVGAAEVQTAGGRVERIVLTHDTSTTEVIQRVLSSGA